MLAENDLADKVWVTALDTGGLDVGDNKVFSVVGSDRDRITDVLVVLGKAVRTASEETGCGSGMRSSFT